MSSLKYFLKVSLYSDAFIDILYIRAREKSIQIAQKIRGGGYFCAIYTKSDLEKSNKSTKMLTNKTKRS